jgi:hypothetical protein
MAFVAQGCHITKCNNKTCTGSTISMQMGSLLGVLVHWGRGGNSPITSHSTSHSRCPFRFPGLIITLRSSANPVRYTREIVQQSRLQQVISHILLSFLPLFITHLALSYSALLCRLLPPLSPSMPWLNELHPCLVGAGSPYKARG